MKEEKSLPGSKAKSSSMVILVDQYTRQLKKYLETGKTVPNPQSFMDRYTKKSRKSELRAQLNITTLLALFGYEQHQKALKALKKGNFLEKSRKRFFDKLKKSNGAS